MSAASEPGRAPDPATEALQLTLAAEHAAVFVYGALGGRVSQSARPRLHADLTEGYAVHRERRDALTAMLTAAGAAPVAAEPGYALSDDLGSPGRIEARARQIEKTSASTYAYLVANTTGARRAWGVDALLDAAVRGLRFGGTPERLPGL